MGVPPSREFLQAHSSCGGVDGTGTASKRVMSFP